MTPYACPQPNKMEGLRKTETCLGYSQTNMSQQHPKLSPQPVEFNLLFSKPKVSLPASVWQCGGANSHSTKSTIISIGKMSKRLYPFAQGIKVTVYLCCLCLLCWATMAHKPSSTSPYVASGKWLPYERRKGKAVHGKRVCICRLQVTVQLDYNPPIYSKQSQNSNQQKNKEAYSAVSKDSHYKTS